MTRIFVLVSVCLHQLPLLTNISESYPMLPRRPSASHHVECGGSPPLFAVRACPDALPGRAKEGRSKLRQRKAGASSRTPHYSGSVVPRIAGIRGRGIHSRPAMVEWPHSPSHAISERGAYIVTAATYGKQPVFRTREHLTLLCEALLRGSSECDWNLQAWAVFPNHYHFVAESGALEPLKVLIRRLHSKTARAVNALDGTAGRQVWFQYWDTRITNQRSYLARLHYVHENAVHHGLIKRAANYPWCSAGWFERTATPAFRREVLAFPCDRTRVPDSFEVGLIS